MGNASTRKAKGRGVQGKGKTIRLKRGRSRNNSRLQPPALNAAAETSRHVPNISVTIRTPPANLLYHLAPSASHVTPAIIPSPCGARAPPLSVGRSSALADKRRIWNYIHSSGPIMVQGFEDWLIVGLTAASGLLCQELRVCHHLGHRSAPSEWDLYSTQTYLLTAHREPRFVQQG
jgi:hypothetical protein